MLLCNMSARHGMGMDWIAIVSGFGIGAIVGMTGVGGGSLMKIGRAHV